MIKANEVKMPHIDTQTELRTMLPSLEIARAHIRALEHDVESARVRAAVPPRRRVRGFLRRSR